MGRPAIPQASRRRLDDVMSRLRALVPDDWQVTIERRSADGGVIRIADDRDTGDVAVVTRDRIEPRDLVRLDVPEPPAIVSAGWLSSRTRELLRKERVGYIDGTGNAELRLTRPGLFVRTDGATRDPTPRPKRGPSLRGPRAWALLRTLIEVSPPYTAGQLATALRLDDGYVSRSLQVLLDEQLIERRARGPVTAVEWEPLLRRVIESYTFFGANDTSTWIATAGPEQLVDDLDGKRVGRWTVTGSFVTASIAPVTAPEVAVVYADDPERLAKAAHLLPASTGGNVILAQPYDPIVFHRRREFGRGTPAVSVAQAAIDSVTGSGRMPAEGKALIDWMRRSESRWRSSSLQE